jgi:NADPH:quinone reductase-like Zn-dependent oxidoreductase
MKAIRIHEPTGISGLVFEEVPDAKPMACDVLVKVAACGITHNELDYPIWTCRAGHQRTSIIPGAEVSGVVAALGPGTAGIAVGSTAVQLARWAGAEVIGTGRGHSRPLVMELGADRFVALDADRLEDVTGQADLVFDTIGGEVLARSPALLRPGGTLVSVRAAAPPPGTREDIRTVIFIQESSRAQLIELARLVDEGHLRPQVGAVYPLARAAEAYSAKAAGGIPGRTVLQP